MKTVPDFQPLYKQVYEVLLRRIAQGEWRPGEALPSEQALAAELGVSQGTVRKSLDALTAEKLVQRRQGKGTYVAEHTPDLALFRFFRLSRADGGERVTPQSTPAAVRRRPAKAVEAEKLGLRRGAQVIEIRRTRLIDGEPLISEVIVLPRSLFPGIDRHGELPNTLYSLYQSEFGVSVVVANEELQAVAASREDAKILEVEPGTPLLQIDRIAVDLDGRKVEWRCSRCDTRGIVYAVAVR